VKNCWALLTGDDVIDIARNIKISLCNCKKTFE